MKRIVKNARRTLRLALVLAVGLVWGVTATSSAQAHDYTVLYAFTGGADGNSPHADLIQDKMGNLYGTTNRGGDHGRGVVFKLDRAGKETVLHSFAGHPTDGFDPFGGLVRDEEGNLFGTTRFDGVHFVGTVFQIDPTGKET